MDQTGSADEKRKRSPNFTQKENKLLAELIRSYEQQIDSRKTDHLTNLMKTRAWQELARDFNARMGGDIYRSAKVLRHKYENMKKDIRRDLRGGRSASNTGNQDENPLENFGSQSNNSDDAEMDNDVDIKEIIRVKLMAEDTNQDGFDTFPQFNETASKNTFTPESNQYQQWPESTPELVEDQRKCFREEHKLRTMHMKEKHDLELELMRLEHKERIRMLRQEHDAKMEMLELEKSVSIINKI